MKRKGVMGLGLEEAIRLIVAIMIITGIVLIVMTGTAQAAEAASNTCSFFAGRIASWTGGGIELC